jgi:4-hydroxythreonine-4-phosphate dehydrogenase
MSDALPSIVVTSGEPAGIGPDLCLMLAARDLPARLCVLADIDLLAERARGIGLDVELNAIDDVAGARPHRAGALSVVPLRTAKRSTPGALDTANAAYVLELLRRGCDACLDGSADAMVTAPVQKSVISEAGVPFTGHTEFFAERTGTPLPVMMLASGTLRVALLTTHLPLRAVPSAVTVERFERTCEILHADLAGRFGVSSPRILVLGLNPHAGEQGTLGNEEREILEPSIARLAGRGLRLIGPVSADTAFTRESLDRCDAVLAMYHDQGLAPLKALAFGDVVNVTLGLPIIRTSVDHGTALPLAGTGRARPDSLIAAVRLAGELALRSSGAA